MPAIHFIERAQNYHCVDRAMKEWESGYWSIGERTAQKLVGGFIYLHDAQDEPSRFGGEILSYQLCHGGDYDGKIVFRFKAVAACKGALAGRDGWYRWKKIVW